MIDFLIPMRPVPKARARVTSRGFAYTPKRTADAEKAVASYARQYIKAPLEGPVAMILEFCYEVPKSFSKKDREAALSGILPKTGRPDIDNLGKLCMDSLNGIAFQDDSQIVRLELAKRYGEKNSIHVQILTV